MKELLKKNWWLYTLILATGIGITVTAIIFKAVPFQILPLYNSLIIMALSARANRYSLLYGGANSILYAFVNYSFGLNGQALYCLLFSFPVQIATFALYTRRRYGTSTLFRKMSWGLRGLVAVGFAACWVGTITLLTLLGGDYVLMDTTITLFGILITFLSMLAFVEAPVLNIFNCIIGVAQYVIMLNDGHFDRVTYLIYNVYSTTCVVIGVRRTLALYREQQALKKAQSIQTEQKEKTYEDSLA